MRVRPKKDKEEINKTKRSVSNRRPQRKSPKEHIQAIYDSLKILKTLIATKIKVKRLTVTDTLKAKTGIFGATEKMTLTDNEIDVSSGDLAIDVAGNINLDADGGSVTITDTLPSGYFPSLRLISTDASTAGPIQLFTHNSASPAIGDVLGEIFFQGDDSAGNVTGYASIKGILESPTSGSEEGKISFLVSDGSTSRVGYQMVGDDGKVNVNVGYGAASVTAVAGNITVGGTVDGVDIAARDALHNFSYHYVVANFYSTSSSAAFFVPLVGGVSEIATPGSGSGERFGMIAPHNGTLEKVMFRSEQALRFDFLCELLTASTATEVPATVVGTLNADFSGTPIADDTTYTYDWTGTLTSGANTFSAGQVLAVRLDPTSQYLGDTYCMCVFKYDITT